MVFKRFKCRSICLLYTLRCTKPVTKSKAPCFFPGKGPPYKIHFLTHGKNETLRQPFPGLFSAEEWVGGKRKKPRRRKALETRLTLRQLLCIVIGYQSYLYGLLWLVNLNDDTNFKLVAQFCVRSILKRGIFLSDFFPSFLSIACLHVCPAVDSCPQSKFTRVKVTERGVTCNCLGCEPPPTQSWYGKPIGSLSSNDGNVVIWQIASWDCTKVRTARAARLFFLVQPIKSLFFGVVVALAVVLA